MYVYLHRGYNIQDVADAFGISVDGLWKWCQRWGHLDIFNKFPKPARKKSHKKANPGSWR